MLAALKKERGDASGHEDSLRSQYQILLEAANDKFEDLQRQMQEQLTAKSAQMQQMEKRANDLTRELEVQEE